jgi:rhamnose utilization protein RhaD (predicted bifunctional aldolase and dehydrogenase)
MKATLNDVIKSFVNICDLTSDSVDMIQAGGGNASAKYELDGKSMMVIKASGFLMSEVDETKGYAQIELDKILKILEDVQNSLLPIDDETEINHRTNDANVGVLRPSIETFLHALLPQRYILHVHALTTLLYASSKRFLDDMATQWDQSQSVPKRSSKSEPLSASQSISLSKALLVPYEKPGIHLAMAMMTGLDHYSAHYGISPDVIILQNHGLIVASDNPEAIYESIVAVENDIKAYINLPETFGKIYADQRILKKAIKSVMTHKRIYVRANEDRDLIHYKVGMPSFPDALVFCGLEPMIVETQNQALSTLDLITEATSRYIELYDDFPKVVLLDSVLYFCGESIKKCLEVQDVLKIQDIIRRELGESLVTLSKEQAYTLLNWEAEKYRKNL